MVLGMGMAEASPDRDVTILLADDHIANRTGIKAVIEPRGFKVVAEVANSANALRATIEHRPDVCLIVTWLPGGALNAARLIRQTVPATKLVLLTASSDNDEMFGALRAGADGYLLMSTAPDRLPDALLGVINGEAAIPRALTAQLIQAFRQRGGERRLTFGRDRQTMVLTSREFDVVDRLRRRAPTAEIARQLGISEVTVRRHISSLMHKLGVADRSTLISQLERVTDDDAPPQSAAS